MVVADAERRRMAWQGRSRQGVSLPLHIGRGGLRLTQPVQGGLDARAQARTQDSRRASQVPALQERRDAPVLHHQAGQSVVMAQVGPLEGPRLLHIPLDEAHEQGVRSAGGQLEVPRTVELDDGLHFGARVAQIVIEASEPPESLR